MFCCVCAESCNHVGPHFYCEAHGGRIATPVPAPCPNCGACPTCGQPAQTRAPYQQPETTTIVIDNWSSSQTAPGPSVAF